MRAKMHPSPNRSLLSIEHRRADPATSNRSSSRFATETRSEGFRLNAGFYTASRYWIFPVVTDRKTTDPGGTASEREAGRYPALQMKGTNSLGRPVGQTDLRTGRWRERRHVLSDKLHWPLMPLAMSRERGRKKLIVTRVARWLAGWIGHLAHAADSSLILKRDGIDGTLTRTSLQQEH